MRTSIILALALTSCVPAASDVPAPVAPGGTAGTPGGTPGTNGDPVCTLIGCSSGATIELPLPAALEANTSAVIKACWRDACATAQVPAKDKLCQFTGPPAV